MPTRILRVSASESAPSISEAAEVLRKGGIVAFPTETVYGLGADAFNASAVKRVFEAKGRPADNPVIVHISDLDQFLTLGKEIPPSALTLANVFWPGPLTLVVRHRRDLPEVVTAGLPTVAVRMPDNPTALALIKALGRGIIGPSANISGRPSPTTAAHVFNDLNGKIDLILDAGPARIGIESTVLDLTTSPPTILRLGGLPREALERVIGRISDTKNTEILRRSPGTRYRHYAPKARVILVAAGDAQTLMEFVDRLLREGKKIACILHSLELSKTSDRLRVFASRPEDYAPLLFETMRVCDNDGVDVIIVESIPEVGLGEAVMDRLRRAAEPEGGP